MRSQPIKIICIVVHVLTGIYTRKIPSLLWSVTIGQGRVRHIVLSNLRVNDPYQNEGRLVLKHVKVLKISTRELNLFNKPKMSFPRLGYPAIMKAWEWSAVTTNNVSSSFVISLAT